MSAVLHKLNRKTCGIHGPYSKKHRPGCIQVIKTRRSMISRFLSWFGC